MALQNLIRRVGDVSVEWLPSWEELVGALFILVVGMLILRILTKAILRTVGKGLREQSRELIRKTLLYAGGVLILILVLNAAGVSVGALLGAAGVVGIAVGIASQASLSNIISGLFLVSENFFEIGDVVRIGDQTGTIFSIDLLSIKIKTFDNVFIRVPNQQLIEQTIVNITRFPIRRMDIVVTTPVQQRVSTVCIALSDAAGSCDLVLEEPEPFVLFKEFGENGSRILLGVWFERRHYVTVRNEIVDAIQRVFSERSIPIRTRAIEVSSGGTPDDGTRLTQSRGIVN
ncbi:MAG: mechanosensitive ion channel family protein [Spirochaetales bacterium]|nr:mechanosensitive ion channel family protein [Spirochaetales bacterium]